MTAQAGQCAGQWPSLGWGQHCSHDCCHHWLLVLPVLLRQLLPVSRAPCTQACDAASELWRKHGHSACGSKASRHRRRQCRHSIVSARLVPGTMLRECWHNETVAAYLQIGTVATQGSTAQYRTSTVLVKKGASIQSWASYWDMARQTTAAVPSACKQNHEQRQVCPRLPAVVQPAVTCLSHVPMYNTTHNQCML